MSQRLMSHRPLQQVVGVLVYIYIYIYDLIQAFLALHAIWFERWGASQWIRVVVFSSCQYIVYCAMKFFFTYGTSQFVLFFIWFVHFLHSHFSTSKLRIIQKMLFILAAFANIAIETLHTWVNSLDFVLWSSNSAMTISVTSLVDFTSNPLFSCCWNI